MLWGDIHDGLSAMHATLVGEQSTSDSRFDLSDISLDQMNRFNSFGADAFAAMIETDEPFFD